MGKTNKMTTETFIERAKLVHGNKYDYSKVEYKNNRTKVCIVCPEHGEFWQVPDSHLRGVNCPECGKNIRTKSKTLTLDKWIEKARNVHGEKYDYSKVVYKNGNEYVNIICPEHGEFKQKGKYHINGFGCSKCGYKKLSSNLSLDKDVLLERFDKLYNNKYNYPFFNYKNKTQKIEIFCPIHGIFLQKIENHLNGHSCPLCSHQSFPHTNDSFIKKANSIHENKYDYSKVVYINNKTKVCIICPEHGEFWQVPNYHLMGSGCPECASELSQSSSEIELINFIKNIIPNDEIIISDRNVLKGYELDIYIPSIKIAFEFDGLYWHNEINKPDPKYHLKKTEECEKQGIKLIHIFEDEWRDKREICESRIKNLLGLTENKIFARKCDIKSVDSKSTRDFLNKNHIQGSIGAKFQYGLYYNNELVSLMTFGSLRKNLGQKSTENSYELLRFCNKLNTNVIGGASRLFKHFVKTHNPQFIKSYADRRWSQGDLYDQLKFTFLRFSEPNYFYVINSNRCYRFNFRKDILISKYGCLPEQTEKEFCFSKKWYRIYDCGTKVYEWKKEDI